MKNNVYIHVGLQKTGTTALQNVFSLIDNIQYFHYISWYTKINQYKDVLFSNEDLSGFPIGDRLDRYEILSNLKYVFPDAKIIVGFRDIKSWINSLYHESVRQGYKYTFDRFMSEFDPVYYDNDKYENVLKEYFDEVFVYYYEELKNNFDKVVDNICCFLQKDVPIYKKGEVNISLSDLQVKGLCCINWFCKSWLNKNGLIPGKIPHRLIRRMRI